MKYLFNHIHMQQKKLIFYFSPEWWSSTYYSRLFSVHHVRRVSASGDDCHLLSGLLLSLLLLLLVWMSFHHSSLSAKFLNSSSISIFLIWYFSDTLQLFRFVKIRYFHLWRIQIFNKAKVLENISKQAAVSFPFWQYLPCL